jgi:outer membrane protein OmpA-like peptidoglycan-associated protein
MNTQSIPRKTLLASAVAAVLLTGCSVPVQPDGAASLRSKLSRLQSNPELASRAPVAIKEAELAVSNAEQPQTDKALANHLEFLADRRIDIARAQAEARLAVDQRTGLEQQREALRLKSRTEEADSANQRAAVAQADALGARDAAAEAQRDARQLEDEIAELQARPTDRGLVLTLGDVLFASGTATLNGGQSNNLNKLVGFLNKHQDRNVVIEGYTDSVGSDSFNQNLSERRANAVMSDLVRQGINGKRLSASGKGESSPIGDNGSAAGRQQNRRVEVIVGDPVNPVEQGSDARRRWLESLPPFSYSRKDN